MSDRPSLGSSTKAAGIRYSRRDKSSKKV